MIVSIPILMFHEVTRSPVERYRKYSLTPRELEERLGWLRAYGYETVDLDAARAAWRGEGALPARPLVLTFDDGSRDAVEHAVPVLVDAGYTATFFVVAGLVGATTRWLPAERGIELPLADWPALRAAERAGMRCEAHSVTHPRLASISGEACREELVRGRAILEEGLGHAVRHLAYPFGSFAPAVRDLVAEAGYDTACTVREGLASSRDDRLALPRVPVLGTEGLTEFDQRLRSARVTGPLQAGVQRVARRLGLSRRRGPSA